MIFSKSRPVKIVLVGTGGTGGYIVPQLYRLLYALDRPIRVILCDGDLVEEKNLGRQNFIEADLGKNKAMVLAERYSNAFGIETSYIPQYVEDEEMLEELLEPLQYPQNRYVTNQNGEAVRKVISEIVILIGAVDNNRSRQVFHSVFQRAKELIYIDSGNSKASGQVICGVRRSGKTFYQPVASLYPTDLTHVGYLERGIAFPDKTVNLLDPCCGTGDAVLRLALGHDSRCYGIELDEERAGLAEQKLFRVAYGDFFSSYVGNRSFHTILLNPPYLTVTLGCGLRGRDEKRFLVEAFQALVMGGLMIYIVPYYRMTEDVCQIFTDNFSDISVYRFLDGEFGKFKQIAVLGTRKPRESDEAASASLYTAALHPESLRTLDQLPEGRYQLPDAALDVKIFRGSVFNESELAHQLMASQSLERLLQKDGQEQEMGRPPLPLSIGQVGLIGGSGLINGLMQCDCPHIIKGRIIKERHERREENHSERGELISTDVIETITNRMVFNILTPTGFRSLV